MERITKKRITIFLGLLLGFSVVVGATYYAVKVLDGSKVEKSLAAIEECGNNSNPVLCTRPILRDLLANKSTADVMEVLSSHFSPMRCHYVGHVVGQLTYINTKSIEYALTKCTRACDSACVHGAIGEAFAEKLGLGTPDEDVQVDLQHLSQDDMRTIGKQLCTSAEPCHGVGHAIFQATVDMKTAMSLCDGIGPYVSSCYNGAAMEYADILASRNMRSDPGVELRTPETIASLCPGLPILSKQRSCFRYFPRTVLETYQRAGYSAEDAESQTEKICSAYKTRELRSACYSGIGSHNAYFVLTDQDKALAACKDITNKLNQAACYFGQANVAIEERQDKLIPYCAKLPSAAIQANCYQEVFFFLRKFNVPLENALKLCGDNPLCKAGYTNRNKNPWDEMLKNFAG